MPKSRLLAFLVK